MFVHSVYRTVHSPNAIFFTVHAPGKKILPCILNHVCDAFLRGRYMIPYPFNFAEEVAEYALIGENG